MRKSRIFVLPDAQTDIDEQTDFLTTQVSAALAGRFLDELERVFVQLSRLPRIDRPWTTRTAEL